MKIRVNGEERDLDGDSLTVSAVLGQLGMRDTPVVVELNKTALFKHEIPTTEIKEGDRIEIIRIVAGG